MARATRKFLVYGFVGTCLVLTLALIVYYAWNSTGKQEVRAQAEQNKLQPAAIGAGGTSIAPGKGHLVVAAKRVPRSFDARTGAAPLTLLPDRLPETEYPTAVGPNQDRAAIPLADRRLLIKTTQAFLKRWETFDPPQFMIDVPRGNPYATALAPYLLPNNGDLLNSVSKRDENRQPAQICPYYGCTIGSKFLDSNDLWVSSNVRAYDGEQAYLTAFAIVRYTGNPRADTLADRSWNRAYGILLKRAGERWYIERVVAETVGEVG